MIDEEKLRSAFLQLKTRLEILEERVKELERQLEEETGGLTCTEEELWNF